ncbi:HAD family hydrolase [Amycolatopsis sp. WQ 127309]|uniref:HAD family hydrolase n=1 Tax=Amycolatopsis sp. WQ 127309 TaxID=2932773 RepID=UPI001FF46EE5|nr:HAD-IA family hydrolase [Amycolatopsis sp. WQ 127309]UOZ08826.1 HAD-IA family hydrolase [Amycolatopsis sp. WQ 127309]
MKAAEVLARARALLLDFDGPVCSVFAGIPASTVASQLRDVLTDGGHADLPEAIATSADPFDVFRYAAMIGQDEARYVEAAFAAHEVEAISSATPASGAHELIEAWHRSGRPLAIVSNNGTPAVSAYLDLYNLRASIDFISARTSSNAALLKPSPHLLHQAVSALDVTAGESVFLGDSTTDIEAAHAAGVLSIGYANKPGKNYKLTEAGANAITDTITGLATVT